MRYGFLFALFKRSHDHLRGFLIAAWAGDKIAEFSFPEILFHFPLRPWFFFVSPAYAGKSRTRRCWTKTTAGSPPRMRGKGFGVVRRNGRPRITPAYAGKRQRPRRFPQGDRDHPRVCGEKSIRILRMWERTGSPPRMRGKERPAVDINIVVRITPAYAGKSFFFSCSRRPCWDHPRVCGEKLTAARTTVENIGSPPRMRGKALSTPKKNTVSRITPAYAGKSKRSGALSRGQKDHPRVCGEKSSNVHGGGMFPWITPAYAGKSRQRRRRGRRRQDHPRVCGEKELLAAAVRVHVGSPPRMRGKVPRLGIAEVCGGITPAYAGKSRNGKLHADLG